MEEARDKGWNTTDISKIILIASYPRSGNNWLSLLVTHIIMSVRTHSEGKVDFGATENYYPIYDIDHLYAHNAHETIKKDRSGFIVVKSHLLPSQFHCKWPTLSKKVFLNINLMRNPIDIIPSLFNFLTIHNIIEPIPSSSPEGWNIYMGEEYKEYVKSFIENFGYPNFQKMGFGTWREHVVDWSAPSPLGVPSLSLRYKELVQNPGASLRNISNAGSLGWTEDLIDAAIQEITKDKIRGIFGNKFVLRGEDGYYKEFLTPTQICEAENAFGDLIRHFTL